VKRVCVVVTARPSYSRVKSVLTALQNRPDVKLQIIAAASALAWKHGRVVDLIQEDGFEVNMELPSVIDGNGTLESAIGTGVLLTQMASILDMLSPDCVVTVADRHETLATAIAASYQNIPLCHIQGGEVSGSIDDKVRNAVTQLADIHCVATEQAALNLGDMLKWGFEGTEPLWPLSAHVTGCPGIDLAAEALKLGPLPGHDVVVLQHPVTDEVDQAGAQMRETIEALEGMDALWFWPGEDAGSEAMSKELRLAGLRPVRNRPPLDFLRLLLGSGCLVGNSSVGIRECSFLGVPVVNVGTRQRGRERGPNVLDADHDTAAIRAAVLSVCIAGANRTKGVTLYGDGHAGERIAGILANGAKEAAA
jgi:UDP-hydrolysing UDP-N-acetyl-D-glucosamine 2-epimerase